jgi:hypothetical protein
MVLAIRLKKDESSQLVLVSKKLHLNKSDAAKGLMRRGFTMYQLDEYASGNISLGKLAENLHVSYLEALNLAAKYNVHPEIPEDYLVEASETAKALFRKPVS